MTEEYSRLSVYFGERSRSGGGTSAEALLARLEDRGVRYAVVLRAGEGFGPRHGLQTSTQLSLSEDLPLVLIAVGESGSIASSAVETRDLLDEGLVTVEEVLKWEGEGGAAASGGARYGQITVWLSRGVRIGRRPAWEQLALSFREGGADAGIALLGIDGLVAGRRRRASFFSANREVPLLFSAVGPGYALWQAWHDVSRFVPGAFAEVSEAEALGGASPVATGHPLQPAMRRVAVYGGGLPPGGGVDRQQSLVRLLRRAGAPGATAFQGVYGFAGDQRPHGESFRTLRRRIPVLTEAVDTSEGCDRWLARVEASQGPGQVVVAQRVDRVSRPGGRA